jgi:hypothetical protein
LSSEDHDPDVLPDSGGLSGDYFRQPRFREALIDGRGRFLIGAGAPQRQDRQAGKKKNDSSQHESNLSSDFYVR